MFDQRKLKERLFLVHIMKQHWQQKSGIDVNSSYLLLLNIFATSIRNEYINTVFFLFLFFYINTVLWIDRFCLQLSTKIHLGFVTSVSEAEMLSAIFSMSVRVSLKLWKWFLQESKEFVILLCNKIITISLSLYI